MCYRMSAYDLIGLIENFHCQRMKNTRTFNRMLILNSTVSQLFVPENSNGCETVTFHTKHCMRPIHCVRFRSFGFSFFVCIELVFWCQQIISHRQHHQLIELEFRCICNCILRKIFCLHMRISAGELIHKI